MSRGKWFDFLSISAFALLLVGTPTQAPGASFTVFDVSELQAALASVKTLRGLIPICASCKKIRDDQGYWTQLETYLAQHSDAEFSHGICLDCLRKLYPDLSGEVEARMAKSKPSSDRPHEQSSGENR